jgi:hypothetical protein
MVICGSYMYAFGVSKDMGGKSNNDRRRKEVAVGEVAEGRWRRIYD